MFFLLCCCRSHLFNSNFISDHSTALYRTTVDMFESYHHHCSSALYFHYHHGWKKALLTRLSFAIFPLFPFLSSSSCSCFCSTIPLSLCVHLLSSAVSFSLSRRFSLFLLLFLLFCCSASIAFIGFSTRIDGYLSK